MLGRDRVKDPNDPDPWNSDMSAETQVFRRQAHRTGHQACNRG